MNPKTEETISPSEKKTIFFTKLHLYKSGSLPSLKGTRTSVMTWNQNMGIGESIQEPAQDLNTVTNSISSRHWLFLKYFILLGYLRVSKRPNNQKTFPDRTYYVKYFSFESLRILITQVVISLLCVWCYQSSYMGLIKTHWVVKVFLICGFLQSTAVSYTAWHRAGPSVGMLNGWDEIERKYCQIFNAKLETAKLLRQLNILYLGHFVIPLALYLSTSIRGNLNSNLEGVIVWLTLAIVCSSSGLEALYYIVCSSLSYVLEKICQEIQEQIEMAREGKMIHVYISPARISQWKSLLLMTGKQLKVISEWLSPFGLLVGLTRIVNLSAASYTLLAFLNNYALGEAGNDPLGFKGPAFFIVTYLALITCVTSMGTMIIEVYFAEKVHQANERIINLLSEMDTTDLNIEVKFEVKSLLDIIQDRPSKITYCGAISVDWGMILGIITSSIAYLIILLQFQPIIT